VFVLTTLLWALACWRGWIPWDFFWTTRWEGLAGACTLGLLFTLAIVLPASPTGKGLAADLFLGRIENPQWLGGRIDAKMWLYLVGATMLGLNLYSFAMHHRLAHADDPSPGVVLYAGLFTFFLCEYLFFERVHLYTYDFFAERVGFKLGWGCLVFYPYFYGVGLWAVADLPSPHPPAWLLVLAAITFFGGWSLARGANMQKFAFKRDPSAKFLGIAPQVVTDGDKKLLVSGFWRVSRHVNYLGELGMATGLTLALGYPGVWLTWLYPLYYLVLLVPRQIDDDRRCAAKYGPLWAEYVKRVPYRIVPGIY
jgi:protein-S-isoprenylcysteine O-methyltransferase Ste14